MSDSSEIKPWQQSALDWLDLNVPRLAKVFVLLLVCGLWWLGCWSNGWGYAVVAYGLVGCAASFVWTDNKP
jgi:hypothetical protein